MDLDANPTKKHGRGKKAQALADDPRSLVQQFSDRFRDLLIGGNGENPSDLRHGPKYIYVYKLYSIILIFDPLYFQMNRPSKP